jgi:hypothetical protein
MKDDIGNNSIFLYIEKIILRLGTVAYACNAGYSGGRDWEDQNRRPALAKKKSARPHLHKEVGHVSMYLSSQLWGA